MRIRVTNSRKAVLIVLAAATFAAAGGYHMLVNRRPFLLRQQIFVELSARNKLMEERRALERRLVELKALPRVTLRARELLGLRPPSPDETIHREEARR